MINVKHVSWEWRLVVRTGKSDYQEAGNIHLVSKTRFFPFHKQTWHSCLLPNIESLCDAPTGEGQGQNTFQGMVSTKMGIWVYITREAEISLLVVSAFYSKNKTVLLKRYLAGIDQGMNLGGSRKAHISPPPNSLFPAKPSPFLFFHGFLHEELKQNSWFYLYLLCYCQGCFLWLLSASLGLQYIFHCKVCDTTGNIVQKNV